MKTKDNDIKTHKKTIIAVPYYGALSLPPSGLARIYFLAEVNLEKKAIVEVTLQVWDPKKEPNLFRWLAQMKTNGLICSDSPSNYGVGLRAENIWVFWGQDGEVHEVVQRWILSQQSGFSSFSSEPGGDSRVPLMLEPAWEPC